jgi:hypothetical protein
VRLADGSVAEVEYGLLVLLEAVVDMRSSEGVEESAGHSFAVQSQVRTVREEGGMLQHD